MVVHQGELPDDVVAEAAELQRRFSLLHLAIDAKLELYEGEGATAVQRSELAQVAEHIDRVMTIGAVALEAIDDAEFDEPFEEDPEIDEDEVYDIVKRFAQRRGEGFTLSELRKHLFTLGIAMPADNVEFAQIFTNWRAEIVADKKEAGEKSTWLESGKRNKQNVYVLAEVVTESDFEKAREAARAAEAAQAAAAAKPAAQPAGISVKAQHEPVEVSASEVALQLVANYETEGAAKLVERLAESMQISVPQASRLYGSLQESGKVYRVRRAGRSYFSQTPVERRSGETAGGKVRSKKELTPEQKKNAALILRALSGPYTYVTKPLTPQEIIRAVDGLQADHTVTVEDLKTITLQLQKQGLVTRVQSRQGTKRAKAKRLEVMKIGIRSQEVMRTLKSAEGMSKVRRLIETGGVFEPEE